MAMDNLQALGKTDVELSDLNGTKAEEGGGQKEELDPNLFPLKLMNNNEVTKKQPTPKENQSCVCSGLNKSTCANATQVITRQRWFICIVMFVCLNLYILFGCDVLLALEAAKEKQLRIEYKNFMDTIRPNITSEAFTTLVEKYVGDDEALSQKFTEWGERSKVYNFAFELLSTIGYGVMSPNTDGGRLFCIFFALFGIPYAGVVFAYIANTIINYCAYLLTLQEDKIKAVFMKYDDDNSGTIDMTELQRALEDLEIDASAEEIMQHDLESDGLLSINEFSAAVTKYTKEIKKASQRRVRIYSTLISLTAWLFLGSLFFHHMEDWTYFQSFYFSFISLTTIGLGDYYPSTLSGRAFLLIFAIVGLGLLAVFLSSLGEKMQETQKKLNKKIKQTSQKMHAELQKKASTFHTEVQKKVMTISDMNLNLV